MKKRILFIFCLLILVPLIPQFVFSQEKIEVNFFYSPACSHCIHEKDFLEQLEIKYPEIEIKQFNTFEKEGFNQLKSFYQEFKVPEENYGWVPIIFIKEKYFLGFNQQIGANIENCIKELIEYNTNSQQPCGCNPINQIKPSDETATPIEIDKRISIPIIGEINISQSSPLIISIVLGTLDGFNACAMIALGFLLTILISSGVRKRLILIGGTFILVSGIVYFVFISAWLNLFLALEQIKLITYLVGAIIIFFSVFLLKDYFQGTICKLCQISPKKQTIFTKIEKKLFKRMEKLSTAQLSLPLLLAGVAIVSAGVNLVELVCSFGIPLAFTKILSSLELSTLSYYFYLLVYVLFYMIDDFIIFLIAVLTLRAVSVSEKYLKTIKLISGIVLLVLGILMIFFPEVLIL
ncbi:MAG: hypothetical protein ISS84_00615 [Candidatus Pacebacteria bacterium]|nr:hypothetical protein [Candidatus Paceibacterota bacterium]